MRFALAASLILPIVTPVQADDTLWAALKQGGKVVLMRHAAVERSPATRRCIHPAIAARN